MSESKLRTEVDQGVYIVDEQDRLTSWLRDTNHQGYHEDASELGDSGPVEPTTPARQQPRLISYDELSPISTVFSNGSVFDTSEISNDPWPGDDPFRDDVSDNTSVDNEEWGRELEVNAVQSGKLELRSFACDLETDSLASIDPPSEIDRESENSNVPQHGIPASIVASLIDTTEPRLTQITSCTQCVLANLPCSRTSPSCSRCKRNGQADMCLLHRRMFPEEIRLSDAESCTTPVLLKLRDEHEETLKEKLRLYDKLAERWQAEQDRKNWVLPSVENVRGGFRSRAIHMPRRFPGEGEGEGGWTFRELHLAVEN